MTSAAGVLEDERGRRPWAGDPPQTTAARRRLLDATARCIARDGLASTSVASVATEAGVSRPTVYRYFEDRDALVSGALAAAAARLHDTMVEKTAGLDDPGEIVVEAVVHALDEIPGDPVLRAIWNSAATDGSVVGRFTEPGGVSFARLCLERAVRAAGWNDHEAAEAMELVLRMALSLLVSPEPRRSPRELRAFLRRRLLPSLALHVPTAATTTRPIPDRQPLREPGGSP